MYKIKEQPEDFHVKERTSLKFDENGKYFIYELKKINMTTTDAVKNIAIKSKTKEKAIGYAGLKDKKAVTSQLLSFPKKINEIKTNNMTLKYKGKSSQQLHPGMLESNEFQITIKNCDMVDIKTPKQFINYFDEQRFSNHNIEIGKSIIKKDFEKTLQMLNKTEKIPLSVDGNYLGQLLKYKSKYVKLYVNAYQSYLWNESVKNYIEKKYSNYKMITSYGELTFPKEKIEEIFIPIPGFSKYNELNKKIFEQEKITKHDFIIRQIPYISQEGSSRKVIMSPKNLKMLREKDKIKLTFSLEKGSYATMLIKQLMN